MMRKFYLKAACLTASAACLFSCVDKDGLESTLSGLEDRVTELESAVQKANENSLTAYNMIVGGQVVMDIHAYSDGTVYQIDLSDGSSLHIYISETGEGITPVMGVDEDGNWIYSVDGSQTWTQVTGAEGTVPEFRVSSSYVWEISTDGGSSWTELTDAQGNKLSANMGAFTDSFFTSVEYNEESGSLSLGLATGQNVTIPVYQSLVMTAEGYKDGDLIYVSTPKEYNVTFSEDVTDVIVQRYPQGWRVEITDAGKFIITPDNSNVSSVETVEIWLKSEEGYIRRCVFNFTYLGTNDYQAGNATAWLEFVTGSEKNVLLDFSYAGYDHGESAPAEVTITGTSGSYSASNGYKVYCIDDYGANGNDELSDRDAFVAMLTAVFGAPVVNDAKTQMTFPHKTSAKAVLYFPAGKYILHTSDDDVDGVSQSIIIRSGDYILKGAGRDQTTIVMQDPNQPTNPQQLYSSPDMIQLKHNTGIQYNNVLANVSGDSPKGSFSVTVDGTSSISAGSWVCLYLKNADPEVVAEELYPHSAGSDWVIATSEGVVVKDLHQVKSVSGNTVTFYEPIMHEVKADYGWTILSFAHYENVGVEDICFKGNAKESFDHHATWQDDGAYKPLSMNRLANSWMRRVDFVSVSEACSVIESANVSVYDCKITGNRGHSAIRSQGSSRVFIGAVSDASTGYSMDYQGHDVNTGSDPTLVTGQYHSVGVSKESMGAVLWRNEWGYDSCFESHASQPRATLLDCCQGSLRRWRQGGDNTQMPNHLEDLTLWNFCNTTAFATAVPDLSKWIWWDDSSQWWKFMPAIVIGFHGEAVDFDQSEEQTKRIESNGNPVTPVSLYEAQLQKRLGYVPAWLQELRGKIIN